MVAIIAGFFSVLDVTIAASGEAAIVQTGIGLRLVSIIAGFFAVAQMTVAASGKTAVVETGIGLLGIAVITGFDTKAYDTITANGLRRTIGKAAVGVDVITVITGLRTRITRRDILPPDAIAATRQSATIGTCIRVDLVTVVAGLAPGKRNAIATARQLAVVEASIGIHLVSVVAFLFTGA